MPTEAITDDPFGYLKRLSHTSEPAIRQMIADRDTVCPWPCETPRWWPGKVLAVAR